MSNQVNQISKSNLLGVEIPPFDFDNISLLLSGKLTLQGYLLVAIQILNILNPPEKNIFGGTKDDLTQEQMKLVTVIETELGRHQRSEIISKQVLGYEPPTVATEEPKIKQFNPLLIMPLIKVIMELLRLFRR